jgi:hypothetical protein
MNEPPRPASRLAQYIAILTIVGLFFLAIWLLYGCGGDDSGRGTVSGPTPNVQVNCPGSNTGTTPVFAAERPRTHRTELAASSRSQGDTSVGDTIIHIDTNCGGNTTTTTTATP